MTTKSLNLKEICSIIKVCARNGVSELEYRELKVVFKTKESTVNESAVTQTSVAENFPGHLEDNDEVAPAPEEVVREEELRIKELELANMPVEDPAHYEELLATGKLDETINDIIDED